MNHGIWLAGGMVLLLAAAMQSAVGFGFALFATPLLVWMGVELPHAVALVSTCSMVQSALAAYELRRDTPWGLVFRVTAVRLLFVLVGLWGMKVLVQHGALYIRLALGLVLAAATLMQMASDRPPRPRLAWGWDLLAFPASGVMAGFSGMGGPPLVLWAMAHDWSTRAIRGFLFAVFAASIPLQLVLLRISFGPGIWTYIGLGFASFPLLLLGARLGMPVGNRMSHRTLSRVAGLVLLLISVSAVTQSLMALSRHHPTEGERP